MTSASPTQRSAPPTGDGAADLAKRQAEQVADTGRQQAGEVVAEAKTQTRQLLNDARNQARDRAEGQVSRLAEMLNQVSGELEAMADAGSESNTLSALARDGSSTARDLSRRLQDDGLEGALDNVQRFARRRPVAFLAAAFGTGLALGRITRNADLGEITSDDSSSSGTARTITADPPGISSRSADASAASTPQPVSATASISGSTVAAGRPDPSSDFDKTRSPGSP